jgi:hypothetical protein
VSGVWIRFRRRSEADDAVVDTRSHCPFCGRGVAALKRLIHAPEASICNDCVAAGVHLLRSSNVPGWRPWWRFWGAAPKSEATFGAGYRDMPLACSFCKLGLGEVPALIGDARLNICSVCVRLCVDILREVRHDAAATSNRPSK